METKRFAYLKALTYKNICLVDFWQPAKIRSLSNVTLWLHVMSIGFNESD